MILDVREQGYQPGLGWDESPRWRTPDAPAQSDIEHERRFRNSRPPYQRGAIDRYRTIAPDDKRIGA